MEEIRTKLGNVDLSYDWKQYFRGEVDRVIGGSIRDMASKAKIDPQILIDGRVKDILQLNLEESVRYIERHGLPRVNSVRMLMAHGDSWKDTQSDFVYHEVNEDGSDSIKRVQDWVNEHDGEYEALFVQACNPAGVDIHAQRSFLIYPQNVNNSQEIMFASMGIGNRILTVKTPRNYQGRKPITDPSEQTLVRFSDLSYSLIK